MTARQDLIRSAILGELDRTGSAALDELVELLTGSIERAPGRDEVAVAAWSLDDAGLITVDVADGGDRYRRRRT